MPPKRSIAVGQRPWRLEKCDSTYELLRHHIPSGALAIASEHAKSTKRDKAVTLSDRICCLDCAVSLAYNRVP